MLTKQQAHALIEMLGNHAGSHAEHVSARAASDSTRATYWQAQVKSDFRKLMHFIDSITVKE